MFFFVIYFFSFQGFNLWYYVLCIFSIMSYATPISIFMCLIYHLAFRYCTAIFYVFLGGLNSPAYIHTFQLEHNHSTYVVITISLSCFLNSYFHPPPLDHPILLSHFLCSNVWSVGLMISRYFSALHLFPSHYLLL